MVINHTQHSLYIIATLLEFFKIIQNSRTRQKKLFEDFKVINGLKTFKFIKAVSDTVFGMINAVYHHKSSMFIGAMFQEKLVSHHQAVNTNC